ncbi:hypothetical protein ACWCW7_17735 [Nocardia tengchongensis]
MEEDFKSGEGLAGTLEHQVTYYTSWKRWTLLAMLALTFLTLTTIAENTANLASEDQIPLTRNEFRCIFATMREHRQR